MLIDKVDSLSPSSITNSGALSFPAAATSLVAASSALPSAAVGAAKSTSVPISAVPSSASTHSPTTRQPARTVAKLSVPDIDLQRVPPSVVVKVKEEMDVVFKRNQKPKGHEQYVYDVRVDFEDGDEDNDWDEGDED